MAYTVAIAGKAADRFRVYGEVKMLRSPTAADHIKRHEAGLPMLEPNAKIRFIAEDVVLEGDVTGDRVSIDVAGRIKRVVFYKGEVEVEAVVGSVEIDSDAGAIEIEIVEAPAIDPDAPAPRQIVDEI